MKDSNLQPLIHQMLYRISLIVKAVADWEMEGFDMRPSEPQSDALTDLGSSSASHVTRTARSGQVLQHVPRADTGSSILTLVNVIRSGVRPENDMETRLLKGREFAARIRDKVKQEVERMPRKPTLAALNVGSDPATEYYMGSQKRAAGTRKAPQGDARCRS
ncbi:MAG: hypothetical protein U5N86_11855 [Planctomycetota bacterium]|nr:hypothetical protein [Planctomycetota bacterium]